jgi:hypothetical protein
MKLLGAAVLAIYIGFLVAAHFWAVQGGALEEQPRRPSPKGATR